MNAVWLHALMVAALALPLWLLARRQEVVPEWQGWAMLVAVVLLATQINPTAIGLWRVDSTLSGAGCLGVWPGA